jgi:hypothetical protein
MSNLEQYVNQCCGSGMFLSLIPKKLAGSLVVNCIYIMVTVYKNINNVVGKKIFSDAIQRILKCERAAAVGGIPDVR